MKTTRFSILSAFVLAALAIGASGCGGGADFALAPDSAVEDAAIPSDGSSQDVTPEEAARELVDAMQNNTDNVPSADLPEEDSNHETLSGPETVSETPEAPPQETASNSEIASTPEIEQADSPDATLAPGGPASVADQPLQPTDPGEFSVYQPGQQLQANNQIGATKTSDTPEEELVTASGLSASKTTDEAPSSGVRSPILRVNCGQVRLSGCP